MVAVLLISDNNRHRGTDPGFLRQSAFLHTHKHLHAQDKRHLFNLVEEARGEALDPSLL